MTTDNFLSVLEAVVRIVETHGKALGAIADQLHELATTPDGSADGDRWVPAAKHLAGAVPSRVVNAACATGQIAGARKPGKVWIAPRASIDRWVAQQGSAGMQHGPDSATDGAAMVASWEARSAARQAKLDRSVAKGRVRSAK